jgi:hypothetical protein
VTSDVLMGGELWRVMYWWEPSCDEWCTDGSRVVTSDVLMGAELWQWRTDGRRVVTSDVLMGGELWWGMIWWEASCDEWCTDGRALNGLSVFRC